MRTWPRLVGRRLHTLAVNAGNGCGGSPNRSSEIGCTWYWRFGRRHATGRDFANAPSCDGAMVSGPSRKSAYSRPIFALRPTSWSMRVQRERVLHLERHAQLEVVLQVLADAASVVRDGYAVLLQQRARPDARELQYLRAADRAGRRVSSRAALRRTTSSPPCRRTPRPSARRPSSRSLFVSAPVSTVRLGRLIAGRRNAFDAFQRTPLRWFTSKRETPLVVAAVEIVGPRDAGLDGRVAERLEDVPAQLRGARPATRRPARASRPRRASGPPSS